MMFRAIICCAALIFALLAALSATAQSASAPQPLNLMNFMHGSAKAGPAGTGSAKAASASKHRRTAAGTAVRPYRDVATTSAASSEPPKLPAAAATAYAAQPGEDVQVVSGDEVNAIDLAMNSSASETNGAASRNDSEAHDLIKWADAAQSRSNQRKSDNAAPASEAPGSGTPRDDSWIGRFWAAIGDGFVALAGMVWRLFS